MRWVIDALGMSTWVRADAIAAITAISAVVSTIFALISIGAGLVVAICTTRAMVRAQERSTAAAVTAQHRSTAAGLLVDLQREYASPQMAADLRQLRHFTSNHSELVVEMRDLLKDLTLRDENAKAAARYYVREYEQEYRAARRNVDFYYERTLELHELGYLPPAEFKAITKNAGIALLFDVAKPLAVAVTLIDTCGGDWNRFAKKVAHFKWYERLRAASSYGETEWYIAERDPEESATGPI